MLPVCVSELSFASVSKESLRETIHTKMLWLAGLFSRKSNSLSIHMKSFARGLVLKQRQKILQLRASSADEAGIF